MSGTNIVIWPLSKTLLRRVHYELSIGIPSGLIPPVSFLISTRRTGLGT